MSRRGVVRFGSVLALAILVAGAGCRSSQSSASWKESTQPMAGDEEKDVLYLSSKETIQGKLLYRDRYVHRIQEDGRPGVTEIPSAAVVRCYRAPGSNSALDGAPLDASTAAAPTAAARWYRTPGGPANEDASTITWIYSHPPEECAGKLLPSFRKRPDFYLFAPPGGSLALSNMRNAAYHMHAWPSGLYLPQENDPAAPLTVALPKADAELPEAFLVTSSAVELKGHEAEPKRTLIPSDHISIGLRPLSARAMLLGQPFAGAPVKTTHGELNVFSLGKDNQSFYVYLLDDEKGSHAKVMPRTFAAFQDVVLQAAWTLDVKLLDGTIVGRVLNVPYPPQLPATSKAAISIYAGDPAKDPAVLAAVDLPARASLVLPPKPPTTKAEIWVHAHDAVKEIPEDLFVSYGTGLPKEGATVLEYPDLVTKSPVDQKVTIDFSGSKKEEDYPFPVWVWVRRAAQWKTTGGRLEILPAAATPPASTVKLRRTAAVSGVSWLVPLSFQGPKPLAVQASAGVDPTVAAMGTGLTNGLVRDALAYEMGGNPASITNTVAPFTSGAGAAGGGTPVMNNIQVDVVVPPATSGFGSTPALSGGDGWQPGTYMSRTPGFNGGPTPNPWGIGAYGPVGTAIGEQRYDNQGRLVNNGNPAGQAWLQQQQQGGGSNAGLGVGIPAGAAPGGPTINYPVRRNRP